MDLPPGTGDVAISAAHLVPGSELIVVTTPQLAASEVAERAGALASQLHQRVVGVIENMSYLPCPHCGERVEVFGHGGGQAVADTLTRLTRRARCRCWARSRSTPGCARRATAAPRSWSRRRTRRPRRRCQDRRADRRAVPQPGRAPAGPVPRLRPLPAGPACYGRRRLRRRGPVPGAAAAGAVRWPRRRRAGSPPAAGPARRWPSPPSPGPPHRPRRCCRRQARRPRPAGACGRSTWGSAR